MKDPKNAKRFANPSLAAILSKKWRRARRVSFLALLLGLLA